MIYKKSHGISWILEKIGSNTLTWRLVMLVQSIYRYITDMSYISDTLYSKEFLTVLKQYLRISIKKDWIGRLYGVINPYIDIDGKIDFNNTIIEIDGDNTNSNEYVKNWVYRQFNLIDNLFKINKLYDYINVDINHVGPLNADNYLIVIDVVSRKEMAYMMKRVLKQTILYMIIALCAVILL
nr:MAG TPA: hypothetical protein [Ackermannviridae sp.]